MTPEIKARIETDMAATATMSLAQMLGFLDGYSARFDTEIREGTVTRASVRAHADEALERVRARA